MKIYSIGDLHLSGSTGKSMAIFGNNWKDHHNKIKNNWERLINNEDIVLIPGDISWANKPEDVMEDLLWIHNLPGKKIITKGNHDYWWQSLKKVCDILPSSIYALQGNCYISEDVAIAGTRFWEDSTLNFNSYIEWQSREELGLTPEKDKSVDDKKILKREMGRIELTLSSIPGSVKHIIMMLHFPPVDFTFQQNLAADTLCKYGVNTCIFAHLHSLKREMVPKFPVRKWGIDFHLVSCDYLDFCPKRIL